jgi:hypothetical protein
MTIGVICRSREPGPRDLCNATSAASNASSAVFCVIIVRYSARECSWRSGVALCRSRRGTAVVSEYPGRRVIEPWSIGGSPRCGPPRPGGAVNKLRLWR